MKKFKVTFYEDVLGEKETGFMIVPSKDELGARNYAKKICDKFDWAYSIEEIK